MIRAWKGFLRFLVCVACAGIFAASAFCGNARAAEPLLLRNPSLSRDSIAFVYADDIWTVPRTGGEARRLTSQNDVVAGPFFSPDGSQIAWSAKRNGQVNVYAMQATGGVPRRLTWDNSGHFDSGNLAVGWTPDGKDVLFDSMRYSYSDFLQLYKAAADGTGTPTAFPLPSAVEGSISPDGSTIAYVPILQWETAWKHYRGGQTTPIWLVNLSTLDLVKIPRDNSNDSSPVWEGHTVYFLSDRNGPVSLFSYDAGTKQVSQVLDNTGYDLKTVAAGPGALVYEQFGSLHLYDLATHKEHPVDVTIDGDLPEMEPHLANIRPDETENLGISPTGVRLVAEAHGDIFTLPTDKGDTRNLTKTSGVEERDPAWSPDGKSIAYFSDASGEYQLFIRDQDGLKPPKVIDLGPHPSFFYSPHWSPDSKSIAYADKHLHIWYVDVATGKPVLIDTALRGSLGTQLQLSWSLDSKWIAYNRDLPNQYHAIFLYSVETHHSTQITDGMSDAANPAFDPEGKYLYFTASTNGGPSDAGIDLSSLDRWTTSGVYVVVLANKTPSPVPPEAGDEKAVSEEKPGQASNASGQKDESKKPGDQKDEAKKDNEKKPPATVVDLDGIGNRILALPIPQRNYVDLEAGKTGVLYLAEGPAVGRPSEMEGPPIAAVWRFTTKDRKTEEVLSHLTGFGVSFNGDKLFYAQGDAWFTIDAGDLKPGGSQGKPVDNHGMFATIDPRAEYAQMYRETWRIERDFFYDPHLHGLDLAKIEAEYQPYVAGLASRDEFTYLCDEMLGEIEVGHMFVRGPHLPADEPKTGLLGADYTVDNDRYKFSKIYNGQNWTPGLKAPLTLPGVDVHVGDYLLAVSGRELHASDNLYSFFEGTAGQQTAITVSTKPDGSDSRNVTVVPTADEAGLRNLAWINHNIQVVDQLSDGKVAYVYMPNTGGAGYDNFNRYFYAQVNKQGLVLDERYNEGGFIADYIVDVLDRKMLSGAIERDGKPVYDPEGAIFGPKAMIINQSAGSGGDAMPWYFRKAHLGTLVGTRTWGGLVGIGGYPRLIDGGTVTAPRYALFGLHDDWEVEGHGIPPDVEVEVLPKDVAAGHDAQLERAVSIVMQQLKEHPVVYPPIPPYPNHHLHDGLGVN
ncbi:MAG: PDZ domain-containing protein [Acidobacteriaceae bacterium]